MKERMIAYSALAMGLVPTENQKTFGDAIRALAEQEKLDRITVMVEKGTYCAGCFDLSGDELPEGLEVIVQAEEGAVIRGGRRFGADTWLSPDEEMAQRFAPEVRGKVKMIPLAAYGLTAEDWGEQVPAGGSTAGFYDNAPKGVGSALSVGGERMYVARYPNRGTDLRIEAVVDVGECFEFPPQNYYPERYQMRNLRGTRIVVDKRTAHRMEGWKTPETAWIFGYFYWDWADGSSPIEIDPAHREVYMKYVANYGARAGTPYYLYNIAEELDETGEYYLERTTGNLYFIPYEGADYADFSYGAKPLIRVKGAKRITYRGFTLTCAMTHAIYSEGEEIAFEGMKIDNICGIAVIIGGKNSRIAGSSLTKLAKGAITLNGGDRETLTRGNNLACDNVITHYGQVSETYSAGVSLSGVGNIAMHNEIAYAPHVAVIYGGNDHTIANNDIHHVVLKTSDGGAIYGGRDVVGHGTVIRGNLLRHIGDAPFTPHGIYWDDCLSGQCAMDNVIVDALGWGFEMGGGRENICVNNLVVRSGWEGLQYDDRLEEGFLREGWYTMGHAREHAGQYQSRKPDQAPWCYRHRFTQSVITDFDADPMQKDFFIHPANSVIAHNLTLAPGKPGACIAQTVYAYSRVEDNAVLDASEAIWNDESCELEAGELKSGIDVRALATLAKVGPRK